MPSFPTTAILNWTAANPDAPYFTEKNGFVTATKLGTTNIFFCRNQKFCCSNQKFC